MVGSVPAVLIGSFLSSRAPDRYIRPIITFVIFASGLKYVGVGTTALGWVLCLVALAGGAYWLVRARPWRNGRLADVPAGGPPSFTTAGAPGGMPQPAGRDRVRTAASRPAPPAAEPGRGPASGSAAVSGQRAGGQPVIHGIVM